jgi:sugar O-acyltransferase (sialic acid O-acetyltransferase NeuD family)
MLIYGASGHSKEIIDCLFSNSTFELELFDDDLSKKELLEFKVIGKYKSDYKPSESLIIGIGDNKIRKKVSKIINHSFSKAIDKNTVVSKYSSIGNGTVVFAGAIIQPSCVIGQHCIINTNAGISHDCIIGDFVHIGPNVALCGGVSVGEGTLIGVGSNVIPGIKIGKWAVIGAGTVVTKDVPDYALVVGNPGKIIK